MMGDCPDCGGQGWTPAYHDRCCGGSDWECGAKGCTGPIPDWQQEQCDLCRGSGEVEGIPKEVA